MDKYAEAEEKRAKRNDLHVRMIEQAGEDRVLFMNAKPQEYVDMRFPECVLSSGFKRSRSTPSAAEGVLLLAKM